MVRLKDDVAIVTGAASGIGRAIACKFASEGARVVAADTRDTPINGGPSTVDVIKKDGGTALFAGRICQPVGAGRPDGSSDCRPVRAARHYSQRRRNISPSQCPGDNAGRMGHRHGCQLAGNVHVLQAGHTADDGTGGSDEVRGRVVTSPLSTAWSAPRRCVHMRRQREVP